MCGKERAQGKPPTQFPCDRLVECIENLTILSQTPHEICDDNLIDFQSARPHIHSWRSLSQLLLIKSVGKGAFNIKMAQGRHCHSDKTAKTRFGSAVENSPLKGLLFV